MSSGQDDDAKKALDLARRKLEGGDIEGAIRFAKKSVALHSTVTGQSFLKELEALKAEGGKAPSKSSSSSTSSFMNGGPSNWKTNGKSAASATNLDKNKGPAGPSKREYTQEQAALVKRIRSCKVTQYYEILSLEKDCPEVSIKKAYRKLALSLHPDKNGAPGADEAFKMVGKAFQVLSDPQKRHIYDSHGADPDDRSASMPSFSRGASSYSNSGPMFGEEVSAEDLFNMFFGGAGPAFAGSRGGFGGQGVRFQTFGGGGGGTRFRQAPGGTAGTRPGQAQQPAWVQLLPLFILIGFSLLTQLPSLFTTQPPPDPSFSFERSAFHDLHRQTHTPAKVDYFVNSRQYATHPFFESLLSSNIEKLPFTSTHTDHNSPDYVSDIVQQAKSYEMLPDQLRIPREYLRFETGIEQAYLQRLQTMCNLEVQNRNERLQRARGFFGLGADWDEVKRIEAEEMKHCTKLRSLGYRVQM